MTFGDVNLATDSVRGKWTGSPGAGGWPTIRTYNQETGYEGSFAGDWKESNGLDGAMCDCFGKEETMQRYVEEGAGISAPGVFVNGKLCASFDCLCEQKDGGKCAKKEIDYHAKFLSEPMETVESRYKLLSASMAKSGKVDDWMKARITILKLLKSTRAHEAEETKEEL